MAVTLSPPPTAEEVARYLMSLVPGYYGSSRYYRAIIDTDSAEFAAMHAALVDILTNRFPTIALDWGLRKWEEILDLPIAPPLSYAERRDAILAKLLSVGTPSKPDLIAAIRRTFGIPATIYEPFVDVLYLSDQGRLDDNAHLIDYDYYAPAVLDFIVDGDPAAMPGWLDRNIPAGIKWWMTRRLGSVVEHESRYETWGDYARIFEFAVDLSLALRLDQSGTLSGTRLLSGQYVTGVQQARVLEFIGYGRDLILAGDEEITAGDETIRAGQVTISNSDAIWWEHTSVPIHAELGAAVLGDAILGQEP